MQPDCEYKLVNRGDGNGAKCGDEYGTKMPERKDSWVPFLRQLMIAASCWVLYLEGGLCLGAPTVLIPQLRKEANSTDAVSTEMAIWLSSVIGYASIPWTIIFPITMSYFGRKSTFVFVSFGMIGISICYIISSTPTHILITEILQGMAHGAGLTLSFAISTEYATPEYRSLFLPFKSAMFHWGVWISNAIGTFFYWKYFAVFSFVSALFTLNVFLWPESPAWLSSKGRYEESRVAYKWFAGYNETSERELEDMIASQVQRRKNRKHERNFKSVFSFLWMEEFYKPVLLSVVLILMYLLCGKQVCVMYAIDILKELTGSESSAYTGMLVLDGITVFCMYLGCYIAKFTTRRTLLLGLGVVAGIFLLALSLQCFLTTLSVVSDNKYVAISLLLGFTVAISTGPFIMVMCLVAELLPNNNKSQAVSVTSLVFAITQSTMFKVSPYIFRYWGLHSGFFFYGISVFACLIILYKYLPETKNKSLQEIEECFRSKCLVDSTNDD